MLITRQDIVLHCVCLIKHKVWLIDNHYNNTKWGGDHYLHTYDKYIDYEYVIFDDDEGDPEQNGVTEHRVGDGCVYDLLGRKVATEQQAKDGTWRQYVAPGIYIVHGKKVKR